MSAMQETEFNILYICTSFLWSFGCIKSIIIYFTKIHSNIVSQPRLDFPKGIFAVGLPERLLWKVINLSVWKPLFIILHFFGLFTFICWIFCVLFSYNKYFYIRNIYTYIHICIYIYIYPIFSHSFRSNDQHYHPTWNY